MAKRNSRKKEARKQHQLRIKKQEEREDADSGEEMVEDEVDSDSEHDDVNDDVENAEDSEEDSDEEDVDDEIDMAAVFHGSSNQDDEDDDDEDEEGSDSDEKKKVATAGAVAGSMNSDQYTFDLRKLLAINSDQIPRSVLYGKDETKTTSNGKSITIPLDDSQGQTVNEDFLLSRATEGCTELIRALWQLPTEQSDAGPLVTLPGYDDIRLPRALVSLAAELQQRHDYIFGT